MKDPCHFEKEKCTQVGRVSRQVEQRKQRQTQHACVRAYVCVEKVCEVLGIFNGRLNGRSGAIHFNLGEPEEASQETSL